MSLLGESFSSVAHMMLEEITTVWPFTVGAGKQPALYKPYLSSLLKVRPSRCAWPCVYCAGGGVWMDVCMNST